MPITSTRRSFVTVSGFAAIAALGGASQALAGTLAQPQGKVVLTVSGLIANTNKDGTAQFDMPMP
jgi:hypothetical protein